MDKPSISSYLREHLDDIVKKKEPGPYITISRQYGCDGLEFANLLIERLNERCEENKWKLYHKELLKQLAQDIGLAEEILEKERVARPSLMKDFLRGLLKSNIPDGYEIRKSITAMVRTVAFEGNAVIIGQGGTAATADLENGISIRIEAPKEWRIARVCLREQLSKDQASSRIDEIATASGNICEKCMKNKILACRPLTFWSITPSLAKNNWSNWSCSLWNRRI